MNPVLCFALLIGMNLFWAGSYVVVKLGLESMDPLALIFWRLLLALVVLCVWIAIKGQSIRLKRNEIARILLAGIMLGISNLLWVSGIDLSHASDASLLYSFEPIWGIILASIFLKEKLRYTAIAGFVIVILGVLAALGF